MTIPAAEWSESDEGVRSLVALSGDARAEFEPPSDGDGYLMLKEHGYAGGVLMSADAARAAIAVLSRWLAESRPEPADHPPAIVEGDPDGMDVVSDSMRNYRGFRYIRICGRWVRTHQLPGVSR